MHSLLMTLVRLLPGMSILTSLGSKISLIKKSLKLHSQYFKRSMSKENLHIPYSSGFKKNPVVRLKVTSGSSSSMAKARSSSSWILTQMYFTSWLTQSSSWNNLMIITSSFDELVINCVSKLSYLSGFWGFGVLGFW